MRKILFILALAVLTGLLYANFRGTPYAFTQNGQTSPDGKWVIVYGITKAGAGCTQGGCMGGNNGYFYEQPKTSSGPWRPGGFHSYDTHASLALTANSFSDFEMSLDMNTVKQLRQGAPPNPWEVGWIMFHYAGSFHHYGFNLRPDGFELMKKDNNNQCDGCYVFAKTGSTPKVNFGQWQHVTIRVTNSASGHPHMQIWVDGIVAVDFVDTTSSSRQIATGAMGLYNEDALVNFANVKITPLSRLSSGLLN